MIPGVDIRIVCVPQRMDNVRMNAAALEVPNNRIFVDKKLEGVLVNAHRAWSMPTEEPWVLVMQDDIELCKGFPEIAKRIAATLKDCVVSFFPSEFMHPEKFSYVVRSHYIQTTMASGCALMIPSKLIPDLLEYWKFDAPGDDINVQNWAHDRKIKIITTNPVLIQHLGQESVFNPTRSIGRSPLYNPEPNPDINWENDYYTPSTNILRR